MNIGLIGAGAIGHFLLEEINKNQHGDLQVKSIFVRNMERHQLLEAEFNVKLFTDFDAFLDSEIDIVVEAANISVVKALLPSVMKEKDVVVISIGAFADEAFLSEISMLANERSEAHV